MRLRKDPDSPVWTVTAQTEEEEEFLDDILDALVLKFPRDRPRGEVLEDVDRKSLEKKTNELLQDHFRELQGRKT